MSTRSIVAASAAACASAQGYDTYLFAFGSDQANRVRRDLVISEGFLTSALAVLFLMLILQ